MENEEIPLGPKVPTVATTEDKALNTIDNKKNKEESRWKVNKKLITLKITLFFLYGATSSLVPYLTIHMQNIGLTMEEIALIYLALPFTTFAAPPITGYLVDKFGRYKPVVIVSFLVTAALHHSLLLLPHQETPGIVPPGYIITHPKKMYVEVWWSPCPSRECPEDEELDVVLDTCVDHCLLKKHRHHHRHHHQYHYQRDNKQQILTLHKRLINEDQNLAVKFQQQDNTKIKDLTLHFTKKNTTNLHPNSTQYTLDMHPNLGDPIEQFGIDLDSAEDDDHIMDFKKRFKGKLLKKYGVNVTELEENDLRCGGVVLFANRTVKKYHQQKDYTATNRCILQKCRFLNGGPKVCPPDYNRSDEKIFWIYFVIRFLATIMLNAGMTIMDPIALTMIEKYGGDFGKEKLFSSLGMALFSPITGALIDFNTRRVGHTDYSAAFYMYDVLLIVASFSVYLMPLGTKLPSDNIFRDLRNIVQMPHVVVFIIFLYILGNLWGFIESFLFFYLKDLGAPNYLLGVTVTVGTVSSIPFLYGADNITRRFGHINIIITAFFAHAARLVGYSLIESAWWCFPFEALESISVHMMWVAAATYCAILAPKGLLATLIGVIGMAHFSIGRGSGSFIGGHIIGKFGIRQAFRLMGLIAVISGLIYGLLQYVWLRKTEKRTHYHPEEDEKLKDDEPKFKDQSTMVSFERLSLMIEYNQIGSLSSLGKIREHHIMRARSNSIRRGSYSSGILKISRSGVSTSNTNNINGTITTNGRSGGGGGSKLLKSAGEVNNTRSNSILHLKNLRPTVHSTGKLYSELNCVSEKNLDDLNVPNENDEIVYNNNRKNREMNK